MIQGVTVGFKKQLEINGVGYKAAVKGANLQLEVGFSHPVEFTLPQGIQAAVEANTKITLKGADKELLGLIASKLRKIKPPEPYKGKGVRYLGEQITLKQGKTAGAGGAK
jgi:large subunit ribosomal protein L6